MKLETGPSYKNWKLVRLDNFEMIPGEIVSADEDTGIAVMKREDETTTHEFGPHGFRILLRR